MHRSERIRPRPSTSRSGPPIYTSLISTKESLRDTLLVNKGTGAPAYATITEAETTTLYAIDSAMMLHKIAILNWGRNKHSPATLTNAVDQVTPLSDILAKNSNTLHSIFIAQQVGRAYSYGRFACLWSDACPDFSTMFSNAVRDNITCFQYLPRRSDESSMLSQPVSSLPPSPDQVPRALATLIFSALPGKPKVKIDLHTRQLLRQEVGEDLFTDLDHVVLGALLTNMSGGRKLGRAAPGWINEAQLQEQLLSQRPLCSSRSTETLPLYKAPSSLEGCPPPYASRISLASTRMLTG